MPNYDDREQDLAWKKPDWATGTKLKSTGKAQQMMTDGNLASDITNAPHTKTEGEGNFSKPEWQDGVSESKVGEGNLAKPITNMPHGAGGTGWEKPAWAKNTTLKDTGGRGAALKSGQEIARPIGGIKPIES
jgi:hypothetical protein